MIDFLMLDAGIVQIEELNQEAVAKALYPVCSQFLRANGVISYMEWKSLSPMTREVLAQAGDEIRKNTILDATFAQQSPYNLEALANDYDDEEYQGRKLLRQANANVINRLNAPQGKR